jgi:hypothetical protein
VSACSQDCDDGNPNVNGFLPEDCFDGIDNDCDGLSDCDDDDCASACFELDCSDGVDGDADGDIDCDDSDCATDPVCLEGSCTDGLDGDGDGDIDCDDTDCFEDAYCETECIPTSNDLLSQVGYAVVTGSNIGMLDTYTASCTAGVGGEDVVYTWSAPVTASYTFSTVNSDYDTVLFAQSTCTSGELICNDDGDFDAGELGAEFTLFLNAGESIVLVIDAYDEFEYGNYSLDVFLSSELDCTDGQDDDNDGLIDCFDSDCSSDPSCAVSGCPNFDIGTDVGADVLNGSLLAAPDDNFQASCSTEGGNDVVVAWEATDSGCATFSTTAGAMDTILALFDACPSSGGVELECNDDYSASVYGSELNHDVVAGHTYYIGIDAWSYDVASTYILDVAVQVNSSCN